MEVRPAGRGALPYWWEVCAPREGFRNPAHIAESLFAATLGGVFAGSAREEYLDPARFLSHTYFTENLTQMVRDIVSRMSGGEGPPVTEVQTPFGGGKTHALLTLYHLINSPEQASAALGVQEALGGLQIPSDARVLVFDGQEAGRRARNERGRRVGVNHLGRVGASSRSWRLRQAGHGLGRARRGAGKRGLPAGAGGGVSLPHPDRRTR